MVASHPRNGFILPLLLLFFSQTHTQWLSTFNIQKEISQKSSWQHSTCIDLVILVVLEGRKHWFVLL
ncbi:hypothetical protein L2E82_06092 [Cichorium intybus]|uniref:Uncharacterized protein n=1 Tax=Cichorium intybus TaxID=13427 RepID=A0ACB9H8K8_CICIN|nr:hypothetical protein L2E82_06092 [Cichorium intybus]